MLNLPIELENKSRMELNIIANKLNLINYHNLKKVEIVNSILNQDKEKIESCLWALGVLKFRAYSKAIFSLIFLVNFMIVTIVSWSRFEDIVGTKLYEKGYLDSYMEIALILFAPMVVYYTSKIYFDIWNYKLIVILGCINLITIFGISYYYLYGHLFDVTHWLFYVSLCYYIWLVFMQLKFITKKKNG